jgi:L-aminopeptidase/D-esterase-like protein
VTEDVVIAALEAAGAGPVEAGSVGGGTGMNCYDFKGGSGTASRMVEFAGEDYAVGVFVQANFGDRRELTVAGVPVGEALADDDPIGEHFAPPGAGSIVAIVATDAPLLPQQCAALARRVTTGIARTGTAGSHFSGDLFLALSVGNRGAFTPNHETFQHLGGDRLAMLRFVPWSAMDPFFAAVVQATEESILDALTANETMIGYRGHRSPALPRDRLLALLDARRVR